MARPITAVRLRNFRGIRDAEIELKPLTILLGPNSSGKSSFCRALAALSHSQRVNKLAGAATLSPRTEPEAKAWPVNLGKFDNLAISNQQRVEIEFKTADGPVVYGFGGVGAEWPDLTKLVLPGSPASTLATGPAAAATPILAAAPLEIERPGISAAWTAVSVENKEVAPTIQGIGLVGVALTVETGLSIEFNVPVASDMREFLEKLAYLRASRALHKRRYQPVAGVSEIGYGGEQTASFLLAKRAQSVETWFPDTGSGGKGWVTQPGNLLPTVQAWLAHLQLGDKVVPSEDSEHYHLLDVAVTGTETPRPLTDIGFGVSQVLPIIVGGLVLAEGGTLVVEYPEAHLHPRPQTDLADFFCAMVKSGRRAIIETHSENLFGHICERATEDPTLGDEIAAYFFQGTGTQNPEPIRLRLDTRDTLSYLNKKLLKPARPL